LIGETIREFEILSELGAGGYGAVYRAHDKSVNRDVAMKVILPQHAANPDFKQRFEAEARLVAQLECRQIVPLYSYWQDERGAFLVMRYIRGGSLRRIMAKQEALSLAQTIRIASDIAEALAVAHEHDVIHRDLKPENILVDERGNAYLTDFGIAKRISEPSNITEANAIVGTWAYLSPEQIQSIDVRPQSDIYAFGILLYELLTGKHPFQGVSAAMMIIKHLQEPLPDFSEERPDLPAQLDTIIARATAKEVDERYANILDLIADLKAVVNTSNPTAAPVQIAQPRKPTSPEERNRFSMLQSVRRFWIEGVLENSIHDAVLIELGIKTASGVVDNPWDTLLKTPSGEERRVSENIINVFDQINGKLLILGDPGGGKTTTLLTLARDLLDRAEKDLQHPLPVVFNLSSWSEKRLPLAEWLVEEMNGKYQVPRKVAAEWVENDDLLLLLDGLDEVAADRRNACVQAINTYREEHGFVDVVVCSRIRDYEVLTNQLRLNGAIVIQPLDDEQITHYLDAFGMNVAIIRDLIRQDEQLRELAKSPLILSVMILAYRDASVGDVPDFDNVEAQRNHLFDTYIQRMFNHRSGVKPYSDAETRHYLIWLAKQMQIHVLSVFHIEQLQPGWLTTKQQTTYEREMPFMLGALWAIWWGITYMLIARGYGASIILSGVLLPIPAVGWGFVYTGNRWSKSLYHLLIGVLYGSTLGILIESTYGLPRALLFGGTTTFNATALSYGVGRLLTALGYGQDHVKLADDLRFSPGQVKFVVGVIGFVTGSLIIITPRFVFGAADVSKLNFIAGILISAVLFSLTLLYFSGLTANTVESRTQPNQGIRTSFWNANRLAGFILLQCALIGTLGMALVMPFIVGLSVGLVVGLAMFALIWVALGGYTVVQHITLRNILSRNGLIPQNYARFLDYAASLILLRKVGGGYIFIHRMLLEHFAELDETVD
jgi:serine/threonine protein kinase